VGDPQRLEELRQRVQRDPASLAFAQLAEECRRGGEFLEAVRVCREGLAHHPDYLSARVTLARALIGLEQFDEAAAELSAVLQIAPDNLAALRALAEVQAHRGLRDEALRHYRAALALAPHDADITAAVEHLDRELVRADDSPGIPAPTPAETTIPVGSTPATIAAPGSASEAPFGQGPAAGELTAARTAASRALPRLERWLRAIEPRRSQHAPGGRS